MKIKWKPQEKQEFALKRKEKEILFGGARGGGKTDAGMAWLMYNIANKDFRALVIRRNADDLSDWVDRARDFYSGANAEVTGKPAMIRFPSGAIIRTGHLKDENAYSKYQGHEYQNIVIEELTHIPREDDFEKLLGSCRSVIDIKPQIFCTTNPDGAGYKWVKSRWQIPNKPKEPVIQENRIFIPSRVEDNKYLVEKDPGYLKYLDDIKDVELREAWRSGSWEGINVKGTYYQKQIQTMRAKGLITKVPYDDNLFVNTWWDLGMNDETVIGFFQMHGREWRLVDCYENSGEGLKHYIDYLNDLGYRYNKHYAPHDIVVRELGTGKSRLETAKELGMRFETITDKTGKEKSAVPNLPIVDGINEVRNRLPELYVDAEKCSDLIEALSQYRKEYNDKLNAFRDSPLHDWTCFTGDTKVLTRYGTKPIMELLPSDKILTPKGWRKQTKCQITRQNAQLVEVRFKDGTKVKCTLDHLFLTEKGWVSAKDLRKDTLIQSSLTLSRSTLMVIYIGYGLMRNTLKRAVKYCIGQSGALRLVKFRKVAISIIRMAIQQTINWKIWSALMARNTYQQNGKKIIRREDLVKKQEIKRENGINQKKVDCGIAEWRKEVSLGKNGKEKNGSVCFAKKNLIVLLEKMGILRNTAIQTVKPLVIESVKELNYREDVWDFCVPDGHWFSLENGAVVHNSHYADMIRYWAVTPQQTNTSRPQFKQNNPTFN